MASPRLAALLPRVWLPHFEGFTVLISLGVVAFPFLPLASVDFLAILSRQQKRGTEEPQCLEGRESSVLFWLPRISVKSVGPLGALLSSGAPSFLLPTPGYEENMEKVSSIFTVSSFLLLAAIAITSSPCPHLHLHSPTGFLECSLVPVSDARPSYSAPRFAHLL